MMGRVTEGQTTLQLWLPHTGRHGTGVFPRACCDRDVAIVLALDLDCRTCRGAVDCHCGGGAASLSESAMLS